MNVAIVFITHNRLDYTRLALPRLLEDKTEACDLYIWDNASTDGTQEYLRNAVTDPRIVDVTLSPENVGQAAAMNHGWGRTMAELVGKVDNDCLMTPGWTRILARAHEDIEMLGTVACWHFPIEEFNESLASKKIVEINGHRILRHPWTCGSGFIMKRKTFLKMGPWPSGWRAGTTPYFRRMALAGFVNGFYYPLVLQDHMDDPGSPHSRFHKYDFAQAYGDSYGYNACAIREMGQYMKIREGIIRNLLEGPQDPTYYVGIRARWRRAVSRMRSAVGLRRS